MTSVNPLMTEVDLVQCLFLKAQGYDNIRSPHTGQYDKMFPESCSLRGHPDFQRAMSSAQVGSLCCAVRYLCIHSDNLSNKSFDVAGFCRLCVVRVSHWCSGECICSMQEFDCIMTDGV